MPEPLSISLVPGYLLGDDEALTPAIARAMARPTVALAGSIGAATIDDGAVTTAKLADGVLTADATGRAKMENGYVTEAKLADGAVTAVKHSEAARQDVHQYAAGVFTAGVYAITLSPAATAYTAGMVVRFKADTLNTGATNLNVNGLGEKNLFKNVTTELAAGDIPANAVVTAIYDGTNFQMLAVAGVNSTLYESAEIAIGSGATPTNGLLLDEAHGLGGVPRNVWCVLRCKITEMGYSVDDEVDMTNQNNNSVPNFFLGGSATNVFCVSSTEAVRPALPVKSDGTNWANVTFANWRLVVRATR